MGEEQKPLFIITIHTKSKHVAQGKEKWESRLPNNKMEYIRKAIAARRRIAGEWYVPGVLVHSRKISFRTRKCIDDIILAKYPDAHIMVCGDLNDGPGRC